MVTRFCFSPHTIVAEGEKELPGYHVVISGPPLDAGVLQPRVPELTSHNLFTSQVPDCFSQEAAKVSALPPGPSLWSTHFSVGLPKS